MGAYDLLVTWLYFTMYGIIGATVIAGIAYVVYKTR